ncbi:MAG: cysteine--tRNA ligase [Thermomicrobiales bacterium]
MRLFNTQSGQIERFTAPDGAVRMYVCGVTPYDTTHIGHVFTFLTFDVLIRHLQAKGLEVTYVQNVTDIDDDILRKAGELKISWDELARREVKKLVADMRDLNALEPAHFVLASDHVPAMIEIVERLVEAGCAYVSNGSVYYSVASDSDFGKLSHLDRDEMLPIANERGNDPNDPKKKDPLDFVLWQAAQPGEPTWPSPWGEGRPGWHIECSAMSTQYLGPTLDIHGGGTDLIFPHHECEIAQTENATGKEPFARFWVHVAMVEYQDEKMSKSLGNLVLARDALNAYSSDAIRLYLFSHHYREAWEYREEDVDEWAQLSADLREAADFSAYGIEREVAVSAFREQFLNALDDDLDTPSAIEALREIATAVLEAPEEDDVRDAQQTLRELSGILGLTLNGDVQ